MSFKKMREQLIKSGTIDMSAIGINGALPEGPTQKLIEMIVNENPFLKQVNSKTSDEAKIPFNLFDIDSFALQNLPEGVEPTTRTGVANNGKFVECKPVNVFIQLYFSLIRSAKGKAAAKEWLEKVAKKMGENYVQVGFQGTSFNETSTSVASIRKGWIQLLKDSAKTNKVDVGPFMTDGVISWVATLKAVVAAMPDDYKGSSCKIFMNAADYEAYVIEIADKSGNGHILIDANAKTFLGYTIESRKHLASGTVLFTNPKNLLFGMQKKVEKYTEVKGTMRVVDYTYIAVPGWEIGVEAAAVLAYDITPGDNPSVPVNAPAGVTFTDTDTDTGEIAGTVAIVKATSEADVTHYRIYLGKDADKKALELATLPKTGSNLNFIVPENTVIGDNTNIYVYTVNGIGECATPATVVITDDTGE